MKNDLERYNESTKVDYNVEVMFQNGPDDFEWVYCCDRSSWAEERDAITHAEKYHSNENVRIVKDDPIGRNETVWTHDI